MCIGCAYCKAWRALADKVRHYKKDKERVNTMYRMMKEMKNDTKPTNKLKNPTSFELSDDPFYSEENMLELKKRILNIDLGKSILKEHALIDYDE